MIVIYGWRTMGSVDEIDDQYALTKFFHLFWLPIVPYGSVWITDHGSRSGHPIKLYGKSVVAGYARWWGLIGAGLCSLIAAQTSAATSVGCWILAAALVGTAAWSWRWGRLHGEHSRKLSDANLAAFNTRCEPRLMTDEMANELRGTTGRMWAEVADGKTPSDIARFGAIDNRQATLAYAQLRLSALKLHRMSAREAEQDALRIIESVRELPAVEPYRSTPVATKAVEQAIEQAVEQTRPADPVRSDEVAARIAETIAAELAGEKFHRCKVPSVGLNIDLVLRRDRLLRSHVIVVMRVLNSHGSLAMATPPVARTITDHVGGGTVLLVWIGAQLGSRVERLETGLFNEEIAVRGIFAVDVAGNRVTRTTAKTREATEQLLGKIGRAIDQALDS
jgi:hypothetical protein